MHVNCTTCNLLISLNRIVDSNAMYILHQQVSCAVNYGYKLSGEFKLCGEIMGMSVMQGGPAPHFLSPPIVAHAYCWYDTFNRREKNQKYKSACECVSMVH